MRRLLWPLTALLFSCATPQGPRPEAKAEAPAPIIDREILFGDPELSGARISPDGQFVLFRKPYKDVPNLWVKRTGEPFDAARPLTADTRRPIPGGFWSRDSRYVLFVQDEGGNEDFHLFAVDPTAAADEASGVPAARNLTPYPKTRAMIMALPKGDPGHALVGLNDRDPTSHDVYRVALATGERELLYRNEQQLMGFEADLTGKLRLAIRPTDDGGTEVLAIDGEAPRVLFGCAFEETCQPYRFHPDNRRFYLITDTGERDLTELVLFDPATGEEERVDADPRGEVDFAGAEFSEITDELVATYYVGDRLRTYPRDPGFKAVHEKVRAALPDGDVYFVGATSDERLRLVALTSDVDPGATYLYDDATGKLELLYRPYPDLPSEQLASMKPVRYTARDGLQIPAYLTVPRGVKPEGLPAVLLIHGGPWSRDMWGFDSYAQFLANRGYAVLQPNFRSSTGYGKRFLNLGNGQWGTGTMQHDITDGAKWLVEQGIADPARVAIMGGSYGGYATLAGLAYTPEVYAAGVDIVGPSNLITLLDSIPPYWAPMRKMMFRRMGDPSVPEDRARLEAQSPLHSAKEIRAPLLIIQGANDPRVKQDEADQIAIALRELGRPFSYLVAEDEGHGFRGRDNRIAMIAEIERFLAEHLGGRSQVEVPEQIAARLEKLRVDPASVVRKVVVEAPAELKDPSFRGAALKGHTHRFVRTLQMGEQRMEAKVVRTLSKAKEGGRAAWLLVETADGKMGKVETHTWLDAASLLPLRTLAKQGPATIDFVVAGGKIQGQIVAGAQKLPVDATVDAAVVLGGAPLELAISSLALSPGLTADVRIFDVRSGLAQPHKLEVKAAEQVTVGGVARDALRVEVTPYGEGTPVTLWMAPKAPHTLLRSETTLKGPQGSATLVVERAE